MKDTHETRATRPRRRRAALASLALAATSAALLGTAPSASAVPTGCTAIQIDSRNAKSVCTGGTGEHRVFMAQRHFDPNVGVVECVSPWVPAYSVAHVLCGVHPVVGVRVETR
ncbi:hypothetical protein BZB76_0433 [Actinomadura pelletieri DSM 43383]|uniref:Secreted protein n=1 Tax=Actinomadura pelletieri DSM 43383 TaxID=1120940 RepID=A0A495QXS3_9ACTN|nr:hypothetical protein [Actinomadura pelletieri]RKS78995.1 hypothetical protein BZB76_0433 [Actinomadura pelletieri DSM 43383]